MYTDSTLPKAVRKKFEDLGIDIFYYKMLDSTNAEAKRYAQRAADCRPALFIADGQSEGRGRLGRSFFSPDSTGLYMTLLLKKTHERSFTALTSLSAVVLHDCIKKVFAADTKIKWVNDLYIDDKKVSGILAQSFFVGELSFVALGIGVNISTEDFPEELSDIACSIGSAADSPEEQRALRFALAYEICDGLTRALEDSDRKKYTDSYRKHSCVIGRDIRFFENGVEYEGRAEDITDSGELIVSTASGTKLLSSGEISVRIK